jgi:transcription-repair coupling factor (superfamily II helicase)
MKEKQTKQGLKLLITFIRIDSVEKALEVLKAIKKI